MKRCMIVIDIQPFFNVPETLVKSISQVAEKIPTAAALFIQDEHHLPYEKLNNANGPKDKEKSLIKTKNTFYKNGYNLPKSVIDWLKKEKAEEVIIAGGQTDFPILAAGISLFEAGFKPIIIPSLCYGNEWYQHTVTINIWEGSLGNVYESILDIDL